MYNRKSVGGKQRQNKKTKTKLTNTEKRKTNKVYLHTYCKVGAASKLRLCQTSRKNAPKHTQVNIIGFGLVEKKLLEKERTRVFGKLLHVNFS